jgi:CubicO group peptidase (beta-lactamase class C family)
LRALDEFISNSMKHFYIPGVAVGIWHDGKEYTNGYGVTNVEHPQPVDGDTLFQIGSTTKTFTGTLALRLAEMGKLDLDTPIRTYLPDLKLRDESVASRVTLRHCFTHTSGWAGDYFDDFGMGDDALARYVAAIADLPQQTPLGTLWSYNNSGFALAGRVIEIVTGKTYEEALKELLLDPLGLKMTFIFPQDVMTYNFAVGHNVIDSKPVVAREWALARAANPVGSIVSSAKDQLKYARFHLSDGSPLLKPESIRAMQTVQTNGALDDKFGITWFIRDINGVRTFQHGGATNGQLSAFLFIPERNFALTILTNANRGGELHRQVASYILKEFLGIASGETKIVETTPAQLQEYVGRYNAQLADTEMVIKDNSLVMSQTPKGGFPKKDSPPGPTPPPSRLAFIGKDRVLALDEPFKDTQGEFLRNDDGKIAWFRFGGRIRQRMN